MTDTMVSPEVGFVPVIPEAVIPHMDAEARLGYLNSIPSYGFYGMEDYRADVMNRIVAVGMPVDNFRSLVRERNVSGRERTLGHWGISGHLEGQFAVYELLDRMIPEKQLGTITHESAHANTPLREENARLFGSEALREEAAEFAAALADQTLETGKYLNDYHKDLARRYDLPRGNKDKIDFETFVEETWAISSELAVTNRAHVLQVQEAQHRIIDRQYHRDVAASLKVDLISSGAGELAGVDKYLAALIDGVTDYASLMTHITGLKARFYPDTSLAIAYGRGTVNVASLTEAQQGTILWQQAQAYLDQQQRRAEETDKDLKEARQKNDKKTKKSAAKAGKLALDSK